MTLVGHFKYFLDNTVNLNDTRIATLNQRVDAIAAYLRNNDVFADYFIDLIPQGSYAHRTIIKPVGSREYDADVLLAMKGHPDWTPADYTAELSKAFNAGRYKGMAHKRTRCVYIDYAGEFHIDVVPYIEDRRSITNNKTNAWEHTHPEGVTDWLDTKSRLTDGHLPTVIRLLKYLRDTKTKFSIKSVLLTILVGERIETWRTAIDPDRYRDIPTALVNIMEDLDEYLQIHEQMPPLLDPAGTGQDFSNRWDQDGYANFRKWMHYYTGKVRQAYDATDKTKSLAGWQEVFGPSFQSPPVESAALSVARHDPGEEFLDRKFGIPMPSSSGTVRLVGQVRRDGVHRAYDLPARGNRVDKGRVIDFRLDHCSVTPPYEIYWKVKNSGREAAASRQLRGQVERGNRSRFEHTAYVGSHYVEVFIVKDGICLARDRQQVIVPPKQTY